MTVRFVTTSCPSCPDSYRDFVSFVTMIYSEKRGREVHKVPSHRDTKSTTFKGKSGFIQPHSH